MRRLSVLLTLLTALTLGFAGCGDDGETEVLVDPAPATGDGDPVEDEIAEHGGDDLESEILLYNEDGIGDAKLGDSADEAIFEIAAVLGEPTADDKTAECPSGANRQVSWTGLYAIFSDDVMVGYLGSDQGDDLLFDAAQRSVLKPGDPESQLVTLFPDVTIEETGLGREFWTGADDAGFRGFIDDGIIVGLGAGDLCVFR